VTWREGTKGKMSSRFATERVVLAQDDLVDPSQREAVWLLMEWPHGEKAATDFTATTLPANMSRRQLVRRVKQRWRTERVYEDAKGELGLDHYEGRSFRGWNHHVSHGAGLLRVYRRRALQGFSPLGGKTATRKASPSSRRCGTATRPEPALPGFLHHCAPGPSRASWPTWLPPMPPVSQTAIDGTAWCTCP